MEVTELEEGESDSHHTMSTSSSPPATGPRQQSDIMRRSGDEASATWVHPKKDSSKHWIPVQRDQKPFQCGLCSVTFDINVELVSHIHDHSLTKPYQCGYCKVSYDNNPELIVHVKTHAVFMVHVPPSSTEVCVSVGQPGQTAPPACPNQSGLGPPSEKSQEDAINIKTESNVSSPAHSVNNDSDSEKLPVSFENDTDINLPRMFTPSSRSMVTTRSGTALESEKKCNYEKTIKPEQFEDDDPCPQVEVKSEGGGASVSESVEDQDDKKNTEKPFNCSICGASFKLARYAQDHERRIHKVGKLPQTERVTPSKETSVKETPAKETPARGKQTAKEKNTNENNTGKEQSKSSSKKQAETDPNSENTEKPFHCDLCDASFRLARYVKDHKRRVHKVPLAKHGGAMVFHDCPHCPYKAIERSILRTHIAKVHEKLKPFICPHCENGFKSKYLLDNHVNKVHSTETPFHCQDCGKSFKVKRDLTKHFCKPKECPVCNRPLKCAASYYIHMRRNHSEVHFQCSYCELSGIMTRGQIEQHVRTHTRSVEPYICEVCGKSYTRRMYLTHHRNRVHLKLNNKPYKCTVCQKAFSCHQSLRMHRFQHAGIKRPRCVCEICGKSFARPQYLSDHRNSFHLNTRPYKCNICQKGFNSHPALWMHKLRHTGNKKYPCDQCDKKFYNSSTLRKHALTHTNLRTHACSVCGKTYRTRGSLVYHLKHSHD